jgi:ribosome-associated translation inhibitor RaiA
MQVPLQTSFRGVRKSTAIEDLIRDQAAKLERVCDHIVGCRIAIEKPQKHQKSGNPFRVRIDVTVPPEHELVVTREASEGDLHEQLPTVLRNAFGAMRRQLTKLVEKQHGDIKTHPAQQVGGLVVRLFRNKDTGLSRVRTARKSIFIKTACPEMSLIV